MYIYLYIDRYIYTLKKLIWGLPEDPDDEMNTKTPFQTLHNIYYEINDEQIKCPDIECRKKNTDSKVLFMKYNPKYRTR